MRVRLAFTIRPTINNQVTSFGPGEFEVGNGPGQLPEEFVGFGYVVGSTDPPAEPAEPTESALKRGPGRPPKTQE